MPVTMQSWLIPFLVLILDSQGIRYDRKRPEIDPNLPGILSLGNNLRLFSYPVFHIVTVKHFP